MNWKKRKEKDLLEKREIQNSITLTNTLKHLTSSQGMTGMEAQPL